MTSQANSGPEIDYTSDYIASGQLPIDAGLSQASDTVSNITDAILNAIDNAIGMCQDVANDCATLILNAIANTIISSENALSTVNQLTVNTIDALINAGWTYASSLPGVIQVIPYDPTSILESRTQPNQGALQTNAVDLTSLIMGRVPGHARPSVQSVPTQQSGTTGSSGATPTTTDGTQSIPGSVDTSGSSGTSYIPTDSLASGTGQTTGSVSTGSAQVTTGQVIDTTSAQCGPTKIVVNITEKPQYLSESSVSRIVSAVGVGAVSSQSLTDSAAQLRQNVSDILATLTAAQGAHAALSSIPLLAANPSAANALASLGDALATLSSKINNHNEQTQTAILNCAAAAKKPDKKEPAADLSPFGNILFNPDAIPEDAKIRAYYGSGFSNYIDSDVAEEADLVFNQNVGKHKEYDISIDDLYADGPSEEQIAQRTAGQTT